MRSPIAALILSTSVSCSSSPEPQAVVAGITVKNASFGYGDQVCDIRLVEDELTQKCEGRRLCEVLAAPTLCPEDPPGQGPQKTLRVFYACSEDSGVLHQTSALEGEIVRLVCSATARDWDAR